MTTLPISVSGIHFPFKTNLEREQIHRSRTRESTLKIIFHREIVMLFIESDTESDTLFIIYILSVFLNVNDVFHICLDLKI